MLPTSAPDPGRIAGATHPLAHFKKSIVRGDITTKAVEDLAACEPAHGGAARVHARTAEHRAGGASFYSIVAGSVLMTMCRRTRSTPGMREWFVIRLVVRLN